MIKKLQLIRKFSQLIFLIFIIITFFIDLKIFTLIIAVSTFLGGVFYCSWVCPFGFLQDLATHLRHILKIKTIKIPQKIHKYLKFLRYLFALALLVGFFFLLKIDARLGFFMLLQNKTISSITIISIIIFGLTALFIDRPFCNYFCTDGARYGLISSLRIFTIQRNQTSCLGCGKCDAVCPMNIEVSKKDDVRSLQCINCFNCISACPKEGTLKYKLIDFKNYFFKLKNIFKRT